MTYAYFNPLFTINPVTLPRTGGVVSGLTCHQCLHADLVSVSNPFAQGLILAEIDKFSQDFCQMRDANDLAVTPTM